jgi:DNA modification methylase
MRGWPDECIDCCVTSPPYWGLRDYGCDGQLGIELTPQDYVDHLVAVLAEVRRILRPDGTCWLNIADSYYNGDKGGYAKDRIKAQDSMQRSNLGANFIGAPNRMPQPGLKPKDLTGIPEMLILALRAEGWYYRSRIIWAKPNPMPESVTDRPTKSYEFVYLLSKSAKYYYDAAAIAEPVTGSTIARLSQNVDAQAGSDRVPGKTNGNMKAVGKGAINRKTFRGGGAYTNNNSFDNSAARPNDVPGNCPNPTGTRNARDVWTIATAPFKEEHFATFPPELPRRCILAGCPEGGIVLDPFFGSGTTGMVAEHDLRKWVGIELSPEYCEIARKRTAQQGLFQ